jgi:glycolate oxidase iron-sulfur subunit
VPCTQRRVAGGADATQRLLARLPGVQVVGRDAGGCCGAAGSQLLARPDQADALGDARAAALRAGRPALVVSSNYGCALHLAARLAAGGDPLPVVHPVTLLARRMGAEA